MGWILNDAPLKLLALVLAVMLWSLVRDQIEAEDSVPSAVIEVKDLPSDVRIEGGTLRRVKLKLTGPAGEVERVKTEFERTKASITLRLEGFDGDRGEMGPISERRRLAFPVEGADQVVASFDPPLRYRWFRVKEAVIGVAPPSIDPGRDRADVEMMPGSLKIDEPAQVRVKGPIEVIDELVKEGARLAPDAVDVASYIKQDLDPATQFPWESGFDGWRAEKRLRDPTLLSIEPARVKGTLRLRFVKADPVENLLVPLYPPGTGREDYAKWTWEVSGTGAAYDPERGRIRLTLAAERQVLKDLQTKDTSWCFGFVLPKPPAEGTTPPRDERAPVLFLWLRQENAPSVRLQDSAPFVFVTLRPAPNGGGNGDK